jgi:nucleotide-binding universal stress UspA family protein
MQFVWFIQVCVLTLKLFNVGLKVLAGKENAMNIKKILNPIDGSDHSVNSTRYAIELARLMDARIVLLHCHDRFPIVLAEPYFQQAVNEINQSSEGLIEPFIKMLEQGDVRFDTRIIEGTPGNKIPEIARIEKIDLIVMGSRGVTDFAGLFLGSVAHQVLHKSEVPVFITK